MNIGFRAHDFGSFATVGELAATIGQFQKPSVIQLALKKVIPTAPAVKQYTPQLIDDVRSALAQQQVGVAVIGCYINPVHPDPEARDAQLSQFETCLRLNKEFGCKVVGTETGSCNPDSSYNPDTFDPKVWDILRSSVDRLLQTAVKEDAIVALEAVSRKNTICSISRMARIMEEFDSPHLRVIYDPVNLVPWLGIPELDGSVRTAPSSEAQQAFVQEALDAFGEKIVAIHAKDYILDERGWKIGDIPILTGVMDWPMIFRTLRTNGIDVPILLENLNPTTLADTLEQLRQF